MQPWLDGLEHNENKNKTFRLQATSRKQQATRTKEQATSKRKKGWDPPTSTHQGPRRYVTWTACPKLPGSWAMIRQSVRTAHGSQVQEPWNPHKVSRNKDQGTFLR